MRAPDEPVPNLEVPMRSSVVCLTCSLSLLLATLSCGGSPTPAKSSDDFKDTAAAGHDEPTDTSTAQDQAASGDPADTSQASTPSEPACSLDTSTPAASKIGKVKIITGCASAEKSLKILEQYFPQLHGCFSSELRVNKKAKGEVNIKINVGQKGTYSVRVHKDDITSPEFVECMVRILEPLPYPKPEFGGATIEFVTQLK
jgi:hypothetical protein